eukprot:gene13007-8853_t
MLLFPLKLAALIVCVEFMQLHGTVYFGHLDCVKPVLNVSLNFAGLTHGCFADVSVSLSVETSVCRVRVIDWCVLVLFRFVGLLFKLETLIYVVYGGDLLDV